MSIPFNGGFAPAPVAQAQQNAHEEPAEKQYGPVQIIPASTGASFFLVGGTPEQKEIMKKHGGSYNQRVSGYKFTAENQEVLKSLGLTSTVKIVDPHKAVKVVFEQSFQWDGDMAEIEKHLESLGLKKERRGKGPVTFSGDLTKVESFRRAFNINN